HVLAVLHEEGGALEHGVDLRLLAVVGREDDLAALLGVLDLDATRGLRDRARALRSTSFEELGDTRQTLRDVVRTRGTTLVEGTHRELRSGLTDRLGGDDADRLADVDELAGRERTTVAGGADADRRLAGEHRAHLDRLDAGLDERVDEHIAHVGAGLRD